MARKMSLQIKISAIFSVFITILIGFIILIIGLRMSREVRQVVIAGNEQISIARAQELGEMMDKLKWQLKIMASRDVLIRGEKEPVVQAMSQQGKYISPEVVGAFYIWPDGRYVTTGGAWGSVSDRDYFQEVFINGKPEAVGKAVISRSLQVPIVSTIVAIPDAQGKNKAAVAFQFKLEQLSNIVGGIKLGNTGYGWIVDRDGMVIAHENPEAVMNLNILNADKDGYRGMDALGKLMTTERKGIGTFTNTEGEDITVFFAPVPNSADWTLGISVPTSEINEATTRLIALLVAVAFLGILVAVAISFAIARSISKPIITICNAMGDCAKGDFTLVSVNEKDRLKINERNDELGNLGQSLEQMIMSLKNVVTKVIESARQVSSGSSQLSASSQQISQGATEQAASVEEISASMEEMSSNIKQNAENAKMTESIARKSAQSADMGGKAVMQTVDAMKQIASKIGIIEEIARSTNMLSLNASIEAARAGEFGKGFAVVAAEVGKLAERSSREASEINALSTSSLKIAEEAGVTIAELVPEIRRTADLVQEISSASNEQDAGASQINSAITQLDQVVQQNASISEESASMSEELAGQSEVLLEAISFFRMSETENAGEIALRGDED